MREKKRIEFSSNVRRRRIIGGDRKVLWRALNPLRPLKAPQIFFKFPKAAFPKLWFVKILILNVYL